MSLSNLPEELVAKVATHMDYEDVWNLMESSKRNYRIMKSFKMDKIKLVSLNIIMRNNTVKFCRSFTRGHKRFNWKRMNDVGEPSVMLCNILNEVSAIKRNLNLGKFKLNNDVTKVLNETKAKIAQLSFSGGSVALCPADFIAFCQKFKKTEFSNVEFNDDLWTDEVLTEVIPYTIIDRDDSYTEIKNCVELITDRTLMALVGERGIQKNFHIPDVYNSFTIQGIVDLLQMVRDLQIERIYWNLGTLKTDQTAEARHFFDEDFGEFNLYKIANVEELQSCTIYTLASHSQFESDFSLDSDDALFECFVADNSVITFAVSKL